MSGKLSHKQQLAIAQRLETIRKAVDIDGKKPGSRPTPEQLEALEAFCSYKLKNVVITGGNRSGKSMLLRRLVAWFLAEPNEPGVLWHRRPEWEGPLTGMLVSKSHKQLLGSLLDGIRPFFDGDPDFKIIRNSQGIDRLEYKKTGNIVFCFVHDNAFQCRERVQSFGAHAVFLDEMPSGPNAFTLLEELSARVTDYMGVCGAFFTPKSINPQIKKYVEALEPPAGKKFSLSFINNPGIPEEAKEQRLSEIKALPKHMQETVLTGAWLNSESTVYTLTDEAMESPVNYSPNLWRHVVGVDPGLASAQGVVVAAEDPSTGKWYVVHACKMEGLLDSDDGVEKVYQLIQQYRWNVCQVTYDPAGIYWFKSAKKHPAMSKYKITAPFNKNSTERKEEMISNLQIALGTRLFVPPWNEELIEEFNLCEWSDVNEGKIKKGQKYHCFTGDNLVWTKRGPVPIRDVRVGDLVYTHTGKLEPVLKVWKRTANSVRRVECKGRIPILATGNHEFRTVEFKRCSGGGLTGQLRPVANSDSWTPCECLPKVKSKDQRRRWPLCPEFRTEASDVGHEQLQQSFIDGYFMAEGSTSAKAGGVSFAGHVRETKVVDFLDSFARETCKVFEVGRPRQSYFKVLNTHGNARVAYIYSKPWLERYSKFSADVNKHLPESIFEELTVDKALWLLAGYLFGDGCFTSETCGIRASTISYKMATQLQQIAHIAGITVNINKVLRKGRWESSPGAKDAWTVNIPKTSSKVFWEKVVNIPELRKIYEDKDLRGVESLQSITKGTATYEFFHENNRVFPIESNEEVQGEVEVFTLTVANDHSYIVNGIAVKNCLDGLRYVVDTLPKFVPGVKQGSDLIEARNIHLRESHEKWQREQSRPKGGGWRGGRIVGVQRMTISRRRGV